NEATIERGLAPVEEITLDSQDLHRVLAGLAHTAQHFDDEATRQQEITTIMVGHSLGLLAALVNTVIAELFNDEGNQLRKLHARLAHAAGLNHPCPASDSRQPGRE